MPDTYTGDLLASAEEALSPPTNLPAVQLGEWYSRTLRNRLPLIREALRLAREEGDSELATLLIDRAIADHPAPTVPPAHSFGAVGGEGALLKLPVQANSGDDELVVPEHVLCALLHRHWSMTVEGKPPQETYVAFRPFNWAGQGDRFERITAPTRTELLHLLARRHLGARWVNPNPPTSD